MRKIIEGNFTDYVFLFGHERTTFADASVRSALLAGKLYILMEDDAPGGFLCLTGTTHDTTKRVQYLAVVPEKQGQGLARCLMAHALANAEGNLRLNIADSAKSYPVIRHLALELGFVEVSSCLVFSTGEEKPFSGWYDFMNAKGKRYVELLLTRGYSVCSFQEASPEELAAVYHSADSAYANLLNPKIFFEDENRKMDRQMSYLCMKNGELAAYSLVTRQDEQTAVFEEISAAKQEQGSGCIFLPFAYSMKAFGESGCNRAAYTMYEDNVHANAFRRKLLANITAHEHRSYNFLWKKKQTGEG
ncbi:MAG: GNAT family N-acetyltransferase [Selenomonas sp.]|uniref:GNAT family N-acetyltransferase n=1 Tax=Selenomonas sp. TaxID=2053611 RepID=UPI0025F13531|nr:GNAT family N-acetyltransferase [Selenomonas sp.]MCR5757199.1 GNAT family N-acetyltransferase [Selenomonas sp.]